MWMYGYDFVNRNVLRRCLKITSDGAGVTWGGKNVHTLAPATGNARLPTVVRRTRTGGAASRWDAEDRSRCLDVLSARRVKHDCRCVGAVPWMARYVRTASLKEMRSCDMQYNFEHVLHFVNHINKNLSRKWLGVGVIDHGNPVVPS